MKRGKQKLNYLKGFGSIALGKVIVTFMLCLLSFFHYSQDSNFIKVHFLYGSKPLKKFKNIEKKWFGGILGGHVGVEKDSNEILNFVPRGQLHYIRNEDEKHSAFVNYRSGSFYAILDGKSDSVKKAVVFIPLSQQQLQKFDSIAQLYQERTPYDYAFWGMRCGAAGYDVLSQIDVLPKYRYQRTFKKIFYPRKLRKLLFKLAQENGWRVEKSEGRKQRKWEKD